MDAWQKKKILILGTTYPSHSKKYTEIVCTGGIEEDTCRMVRLHPVPMRYMQAEQHFQKFQWIEAKIRKHDTDPRPESYRIDKDSIQVGAVVRDHDVRRCYLDNSRHLISSLEALKEKQLKDGTSLGIIKPKDILDCTIEYRPSAERAEWEHAERARMAQQKLFGETVKPLDFPEARFMVQWQCADVSCPTHSMGLLVWGIHELYRKLKAKGDKDYEAKVLQKMEEQLNQWERDVYLFLGNFRAIQYNFGLMDSYSAPEIHSSAPTLFT